MKYNVDVCQVNCLTVKLNVVRPGEGAGWRTPLFGPHRDVPLDMVWLFVLNRVYCRKSSGVLLSFVAFVVVNAILALF